MSALAENHDRMIAARLAKGLAIAKPNNPAPTTTNPNNVAGGKIGLLIFVCLERASAYPERLFPLEPESAAVVAARKPILYRALVPPSEKVR